MRIVFICLMLNLFSLLPIEGELSEGLRGSLLFHSHFNAIGQAALACNDYGSSVSNAAQEFVCIAEALAELYSHVIHLTVIVYVYEALT